MNIKGFVERTKRVLLVASKPDKEEFKLSAKITSIGMVIIGVIGFAVFLLAQLVGGL